MRSPYWKNGGSETNPTKKWWLDFQGDGIIYLGSRQATWCFLLDDDLNILKFVNQPILDFWGDFLWFLRIGPWDSSPDKKSMSNMKGTNPNSEKVRSKISNSHEKCWLPFNMAPKSSWQPIIFLDRGRSGRLCGREQFDGFEVEIANGQHFQMLEVPFGKCPPWK